MLSACENKFITNSIVKGKRLDGRTLTVGRSLELVFGSERGCCIVILGNTRVLTQVSCEMTEPKPARPTEGSLHINLELSPMARSDIKLNRSSDEAIEYQCLIERCVRDSKCIDLESLCVVAGSKVWTIRVDVHTLNDDGNLIECASIAAISALAHFRRSEVTVVGTDVTIHSMDDREPVALNLHHMPININLAIYKEGSHIVVDPIEIEEKVADGCFIIGVNSHQEICVEHYRGVLMLKPETVLRCLSVAIKRVQAVTQVIKAALDDDAYKRKTNAPIGFISMLKTGTILGAKRFMPEINLKDVSEEGTEVIDVDDAEDVSPAGDQNVTSVVKPSAAKEKALEILQNAEEIAVFEGGRSKWGIDSDSDDDDDNNDNNKEVKEDVSTVIEVEDTNDQSTSLKEEEDAESEESSEEETVFMDSDQVDVKSSKSRGWYSKNPFS